MNKQQAICCCRTRLFLVNWVGFCFLPRQFKKMRARQHSCMIYLASVLNVLYCMQDCINSKLGPSQIDHKPNPPTPTFPLQHDAHWIVPHQHTSVGGSFMLLLVLKYVFVFVSVGCTHFGYSVKPCWTLVIAAMLQVGLGCHCALLLCYSEVEVDEDCGY